MNSRFQSSSAVGIVTNPIVTFENVPNNIKYQIWWARVVNYLLQNLDHVTQLTL